MSLKHGVYAQEKATSLVTPLVADVGIPFVVGAAPVQSAGSPARPNVPVLCTSWDEAVAKLGFSYDWEAYPICEFMYSHFQLFGCQPVIFCNVMDPARMKTEAAAAEYAVTDHVVRLPFSTLGDSIAVSLPGGEQDPGAPEGTGGGTALERDEDYSVLYDENENACIVELLGSGSAYGAEKLLITCAEAAPEEVILADIVEGLGVVDDCLSQVGVIPDLICAPGWSHNTVAAAVMATKAAGIVGLFRAKALIDCDTGEEGVREYSELTPYKNRNNFVDENQILCWPMVKLGDYRLHMSTQLAGLMAKVDTGNDGCPYESPSNKNFKMDGCCLADGTEVNLSFLQANMVNSYGIVTALNFLTGGWTCWGNYTACYPGNTDVKDYFIPVSRMFDWVANTVIRTFWSKIDKPMIPRLIDTILDTCNIWINGLVGMERLLGGRVELLDAENTTLDLMAGIIYFHIFMTPASPMQECNFILEYDPEYVKAALGR